MTFAHAVVWIDHIEATIIEFSQHDHRVSTIHVDRPRGKLHHKAGAPGSGREATDPSFFDAVVHAVSAPKILLVGPGTAKVTFDRSMKENHPEFAKRIVDVQTVDHPTHGQLLAVARDFFRRYDQLNQ